jgi:hypothetical protein
MYRKEVFDKLIDRVERRNGKIYLYQGEYPKEGRPMDLLQSFPSHLLESEEEQQAVLVHLASDDAVGWMHELVKHMLTGEYQFILLSNSVHGIEYSTNRIQRLALTLKRSPS